MAELKVTLSFLGFILLCSSCGSSPPVPVWPDKFTINFDVLVEKYGDDWKSNGTLYYDYNIKVWLDTNCIYIFTCMVCIACYIMANMQHVASNITEKHVANSIFGNMLLIGSYQQVIVLCMKAFSHVHM